MGSETTRVINKSVIEEAQTASHGRGLAGQDHTLLPDRPVVANDANAASTAFNLRDIWLHRELLFFLTWRDVKVKYKQTAMGAAWAVIQPLFMVLVFAVFFGIFMQVPTDDMPHLVFFYCGLMPWIFFSTSLSLSSVSLINNTNLITKIYFPRTIIPIATIGANVPDLLIAVAILLGVALYYKIALTWHLLMLPALLGLTMWLAAAFGIWLAALTVRYRDIRHALPFVIQLWFFITPIIFPLSVVPKRWHWAMYLNPMTGIVEGIRSSVVGKDFNWTAIACSFAIAFLTFVASIYAFRRLEKSFADVL